MWKTVGKALLILVFGIMTGMLLMALAYMIPMNESCENVQKSLEILDTEGWYPTMPLVSSFEGTMSGMNTEGILDNYTDSIMVTAAAADAKGNPLYQAMEVASSMMKEGYSYYWHGYVTILRPLLLFVHYGEIRILNQMLQILLLVVLCCLLYRKKGMPWVFLTVTIYILLMPLAMAMSLQYSWVFYIGMAGSILMVKYDSFFADRKRLCLLTLILGMLTAYFDLLTYPLFTWGIPVLWWIIMGRKEDTDGWRLTGVILSGFFWILGYGGMWAGKWILGQWILHRNVIAVAWNEVQYRAGMYEGTEGSEVSRFAPVISHWRIYGNVQTVCILAGWNLWFLYRYWKGHGAVKAQKTFSLAMLAASSIVWYFVLHNHTFIHSFAYRIYVISFAAVLAAMILAVEKRETQEVWNCCGRAGQKAFRYSLPVVVIAFSVLLAMQDRQIYHIHNGGSLSRQLALEQGCFFEQSFIPAYSRIDYMNLGIMALGEKEGVFVIELLKDDVVCYQAQLSAKTVAESGFYKLKVGWKLHKGEEYLIRISVQDGGATEYLVSLTRDNDLALEECANSSFGQKTLDGQMILGFGYLGYRKPVQMLLEIFTFTGIFWLMITGVLQAHSVRKKAA